MIKIHTPPHTLFAAQILCEKLNEMGRYTMIVDRIDRRDPDLYIIYNAAAHNFINLPKRYIVMQTEIPGTHWFNQAYHKIIKHAIAVWDYCAANQYAYEHRNKSIVPPGVRLPGVYKKDIDYLFYGWIEGSPRRRRILDELKEAGIQVLEITNKLGPEMWDILKRTKLVINIHYHDYSPLEWYRICEAYSFGCNVITETSPTYGGELSAHNVRKNLDYDPNYMLNRGYKLFDNTHEIAEALKQAGI